MKHLQLTLDTLREQRTNLDAAISAIETLLGVSSNGHGEPQTITLPADPPTKRATQHWTQTAAGKRKMAVIQKKAWAARRAHAKH